MNFKRKTFITTALAATLAAATLIGGGTFAYLKEEAQEVVNEFNTNSVTVDITETANNYQIIPGTSQTKDPTVMVNATIPAYVYVIVDDHTEGLAGYEIDERWTALGGEYPGVYWCEVGGGEDPQAIPVLKDNKVTYDKALENSDMLDQDGRLKENITLTFRAKAIQKEPFNNPIDAYEERVPIKNTLTVTFESTGNQEKFIAQSFDTQDSFLFKAAPIKFFYPSNAYWRDVEYTFSITGSSNQDMTLAFNFEKQCGAGEEYKGTAFEDGFGGFGDLYALEGEYLDWLTSDISDDYFTLVGNYYPIVFTVTQTKSNGITDFKTFTGSLTELAEKLSSSPIRLQAGTEYDEEFTITMLWAYQTEPTDDCYVLKDGKKDEADPNLPVGYMDRADNIFDYTDGLETVGYELWADFEVMIQEAGKT